ncbi:MAG: biopolymer transporter ExbD [Verrucomicrobiae bacterium]|nr:biopolymer transporter ExbD [Verrucomicrobiae bacterium]
MSKPRGSTQAFPEEDPEFQVAPMVDVLLVLMVFFMSITSTEVLKTKTKFTTIELAVANNSKEALKNGPPEVVINIGWTANDGVLEFEEKVIKSPDDLTNIILQRKGKNASFRAKLRASRGVPYRYMQNVMAACAAADIDNITFMVLDKEVPGNKTYKK